VMRLMREIDADIYHTMEPNWGTYVARRSMPDRKHVVTSIDPRNAFDWFIEFLHYSPSRKLMFPFIVGFERNPLITRAVQRADYVGCQTLFIIPKVRRMYRLRKDPEHLPNPIEVSRREIRKAQKPTVLFLARWDRRKRPEMYLQLALRFPEVEFIMLGKSRDSSQDRWLRERYGGLPNVNMIGFVDQYKDPRFEEILDGTWILINTASREGLPASFQEAAAHQCAILSHVDPDHYASRFGYWARSNDFEAGLRALLEGDAWREKGRAAYEYVLKTNAVDAAIDRHEEVYARVMSQS
jgi:glycosyltransferase involved in cell wall biosynthesis